MHSHLWEGFLLVGCDDNPVLVLILLGLMRTEHLHEHLQHPGPHADTEPLTLRFTWGEDLNQQPLDPSCALASELHHPRCEIGNGMFTSSWVWIVSWFVPFSVWLVLCVWCPRLHGWHPVPLPHPPVSREKGSCESSQLLQQRLPCVTTGKVFIVLVYWQMVVCNRDCPVLLQVRFSLHCLLHWYLVQWWSVVYKMQRTSLCTGKVFCTVTVTASSLQQRLPCVMAGSVHCPRTVTACSLLERPPCVPAGSCSLSWHWQPVVYHRECPVSPQVGVLCPGIDSL